MSLVNQVLKDLQHRRSDHPDTSGLLAAASLPPPQRGGRWLLFGGAAVLVGLALFAAQRVLLSSPAPALPTTTGELADEPPRPAVETTATADAGAEQPEPIALAAEQSAEQPRGVVDAPVEAPVEAPIEAAATVVEPAPERSRPAASAQHPADREPQLQPLTRTLVTSTPRQRAERAYGAGVRALSEDRRDLAEAQFRESLGHDASHADARLALANVLAGNGALREAEAQLQQGLRIAPQAAPLAERYARLLLERGDLAGAIGVLADAAPPIVTNPEYHALLAALQQRAGNHVAAADTYAALVVVKPDAGLWWVGLGISLEAEQRNTAAYDAYRNATRDPRLTAEVAAFVRERLAVLAP